MTDGVAGDGKLLGCPRDALMAVAWLGSLLAAVVKMHTDAVFWAITIFPVAVFVANKIFLKREGYWLNTASVYILFFLDVGFALTAYVIQAVQL